MTHKCEYEFCDKMAKDNYPFCYEHYKIMKENRGLPAIEVELSQKKKLMIYSSIDYQKRTFNGVQHFVIPMGWNIEPKKQGLLGGFLNKKPKQEEAEINIPEHGGPFEIYISKKCQNCGGEIVLSIPVGIIADPLHFKCKRCPWKKKALDYVEERFQQEALQEPQQGNVDYKNYINSGSWKQKVAEKLKLANWKCQRCGASGIKLDVHHLHYETLGNEDLDTDVIAVCRKCHLEMELEKEKVKSKVS